MKLKMTLCIAVLSLFGLAMAHTPAPQDEENVRGAFLTSRPKEKPAQSSSSSKPVRRRQKPAGTSSPSNSNSNMSGTTSGTSTQTAPPNLTTALTSSNTGTKTLPPLGLGMTLFTRDSNGLAVRVDPSREFHKGDAVRLLLETNADGYLYIFNTTDGGQPVMIYPSHEIEKGGNFIQSHVPFEIPSSAATEERVRWFRFDQYPGTERLYFVFVREPLPGIPIEDDLVNYCREGKQCPWRPAPEVWVQVQAQVSVPLKVDKASTYGRAQTDSEHNASTRGIGLSQQDPEPSLIMMTVSRNANSLVTSLDLIHK
jgi:Domain of unknown function (DUF4384)